MSSSSPENTDPVPRGCLSGLLRTAGKLALLGGVIAFILFPRVDLLFRQARNWTDMDALIMPELPEIVRMNKEITQSLPPEFSAQDEIRAVETYVMRHVAYVHDWDQWWNVDYWPTSAEVCASGAEDCDGRAVLAVTLLRARGFAGASLTGNLNHMWATVIPRKDGIAAPPMEIMQPDKEANLSRNPDGTARISLPGPGVVREFFTGIRRFPAWRISLILAAALAFFCSPRRSPRTFWPLLSLLFLAQIILADWSVRHAAAGRDTGFYTGILLCMAAFLAAAIAAKRR